jgi:hypothetical protein
MLPVLPLEESIKYPFVLCSSYFFNTQAWDSIFFTYMLQVFYTAIQQWMSKAHENAQDWGMDMKKEDGNKKPSNF